MVKKYEKKYKGLRLPEFTPGMKVGLRRARPGKLKDDAELGFEFIRYLDEYLSTALIRKLATQTIRECSVMDLIPLKDPTPTTNFHCPRYELLVVSSPESTKRKTVVCSWNVASLRAMNKRAPGALEKLIKARSVDILCL